MFTSRPYHTSTESTQDWSGGLYCEVVATTIDIQMLAPEWEGLFDGVEAPSLCSHPDWTLAWWKNFGQEHQGAGEETQPYILTVRNVDRELIGVVPMYEDQPTSIFKIRRLRSIGYLGRERAYDMTEEPTILIKSGYEAMASKAIQRHLRTELRAGRWDFIAIISPSHVPLNEASVWDGVAISRSDLRSGSDFVELPGTWNEYRKRLSKSMRENLPYYPRLLNRDGHEWELRTIDQPELIPDAIDRLTSLHQSRAECTRGRQHSNHLHTKVQSGFLKEFLSSMAANRSGFIIELVVGGIVVASQAFYGSGEVLTVSYSGFDEDFYRYSPIFIIHAHVFRDALERGVRKLNLLRNIAQWKTRWLACTGESMTRIYLVNKRPASVLRYLWHTAKVGIERDVILRAPVLWGRLVRRFK